MRVNPRVFTEKRDMLDGIRIPNCPSQFKTIAENIMDMVTKPGYSVGDYNTMTELDKILLIDYWQEYDGLPPFGNGFLLDKGWLIHKATSAELLRRARQWLVEHQYLIGIKPDVAERAFEAGNKFSRSIKQ